MYATTSRKHNENKKQNEKTERFKKTPLTIYMGSLQKIT